jgi:iron complex outermembrane recepter protein
VFSYSYLQTILNWEDPSLAVEPLKNFIGALSPRHQVAVRSGIDIAENWQFNGWLRYVDSIEGRSSLDTLREPKFVDDYFNLDVNLTWKPRKDLEIMLAGQNLLNSSHLEYISELITPPTEIQRSFYAKITWRF